MHTIKELETKSMGDLRKIGEGLDVKDSKKSGLIEKILEGEAQLETASTIDSEDLINDTTVADVVVDELVEEFDGEPPIVEELWSDNKDLGAWPHDADESMAEDNSADDDWVLSSGINLIKSGHSIGSIISKFCTYHGVTTTHAAKQGIYSRCNAIMKEKRYNDLSDIFKSTFLK